MAQNPPAPTLRDAIRQEVSEGVKRTLQEILNEEARDLAELTAAVALASIPVRGGLGMAALPLYRRTFTGEYYPTALIEEEEGDRPHRLSPWDDFAISTLSAGMETLAAPALLPALILPTWAAARALSKNYPEYKPVAYLMHGLPGLLYSTLSASASLPLARSIVLGNAYPTWKPRRGRAMEATSAADLLQGFIRGLPLAVFSTLSAPRWAAVMDEIGL